MVGKTTKQGQKRKHNKTQKIRRRRPRRVMKKGGEGEPTSTETATPPPKEETTPETTVVSSNDNNAKKERSMSRGFQTIAKELLSNGISRKALNNLANNDELKGDLTKVAHKYGTDSNQFTQEMKKVKTQSENLGSYDQHTMTDVEPPTATGNTYTDKTVENDATNPEVEELRNQLLLLQKEYLNLLDKVRKLQQANGITDTV